MKNYTLHIPEGVKDYIGAEARLKEKVQNQIKQVFHTYSYNLIETPTFEYLDVFTLGEAGFQQTQLYNLINRQGELVALRSDMTRAIARVACTQNSNMPTPQRYAYVANSFRYPERYQGKLHEFTQAGIELVGNNSAEADAEVIKVAIEALKAAGVSQFTMHIGSSQFLEYMLSDIGLGNNDKEEVYQAIEQKDAVKLKTILEASNIDKDTLAMLLELIQCAGKIDLLRSVKEKIACVRSKEALSYLENIYEILEEYGIHDFILFDFSLLSYGKYYTGIMFQAFTLDIGSAIVEGGRYDTLLCKFGRNLPAVGFGIHINLLLQKIIQHKPLTNLNRSRTLIVYTSSTRSAALEVADGFRKEGLVVENSFDETIEKALDYAKETGIGGVLYFKEADKVIVYNLKENTVEETTINQL
ncbi:ATP phosphoribosyltransferase regulatory subunit [Cellulosilyticum sp. I15G10I2]|uniref:ATP phosphoribosyltransferase regulatory subunit n=1 Tax=Cellulosilyticum sp. I15G10I2 TaxID=1892843 RepID=UPI00085C877A|nr:ATP phosphoribosyltransferase regulatory subunit [Cellulosilyticum sp. I15G10I2]